MPTRHAEVYYVMPTVLEDGRIFKDVSSRFTNRGRAIAWMRKMNGTMGPAKGIRWFIRKLDEWFTPDIPDMTDEELRQAWREWGELQRGPFLHDEMGVADPYLSYPGDMEMWSDYYAEIDKEYRRRDENRCIVDDTREEE